MSFGHASPEPGDAASSAPAACPSRNGLNFICGPVGSEDLVQVPDTPFVIASGLNLGQPAHLYLIDTRARSARVLFPTAASAEVLSPSGGCPSSPDLSRVSFSGLGLRREHGVIRVFVANGGRHAIEFFRFDVKALRLRWEGCALLPANTSPNGVVSLQDGGLLATSFFDPTDAHAWERMGRGEPSGAVLEWHGHGFLPARGLGAVSGPNGLELSADGRLAYVSAWSARKLLIVSRVDGQTRVLPLDFMPDNIHRLDDGTLLIGGQRTTVQSIARCAKECPQPWVVAHVDPVRGTVENLLQGPGDALVNYATGGIVVGGMLYVTARGDNRLIYVPVKLSGERPTRSIER